MSLVRLLTTGRSLMACESSGRYHMSQERLVPKFAARKNPFRTVTAGTAATRTAAAPALVAVATPAAAPVVVVPQPAVVPAAAPVSPAKPAQVAQPVKPTKKSGWFQRLGARLAFWKRNPVQPAVAPAPAPAMALAPQSPRSVVQGELSLDRIKVVRNDLSDADLEVVPKRAPAPAAVRPSEPASAPAATGFKPVSIEAWQRMSSRLRMTTRLFGAGKQ